MDPQCRRVEIVEIVEIVEDGTDGALHVAASIWAAATARRDGLDEAVPPEVKLPGLRAALATLGARLLVATEGHRVTGFVVLVPSDAGLEIRYLAVAPDSWGQGLAARLLRHATKVAAAGGWDVLELWVLADNERAISVYRRAGWSLTSDVKSQVDTRRTEVRLERRLTADAR